MFFLFVRPLAAPIVSAAAPAINRAGCLHCPDLSSGRPIGIYWSHIEKAAEAVRIGDRDISATELRAVCRKWKIARLELFGSARTGRLRPDSDIDLLVDFEPDEQWSLMDLVRAQEEFSRLFRRPVELVDRQSLLRSTNWIRRDAILRDTEPVYGS